METRTLRERVDTLEVRVTALEALPSQVADLTTRTAAMESQILQLRGEMRDEFSAVRAEMREGFVAVTTELGGQILRLEQRFDGLEGRFDGLDKKVDGLDKKVDGLDKKVDGLDKKVDGLDKKVDESSRQARVLFEEVISRLKAMSDGRS